MVSKLAEDRMRLRATFDAAADRYQRARPEYPPELFGALVETAGLGPGARLLEIGCATGKATIPLARWGFRISCVEIGSQLVAAARRNLAGFSNVEIIEGAFENWVPPTDSRFDLVFAATAWHWVDPAVRYRKAWDLLRPGGHLAFWSASHVFPVDGDPFFAEIQQLYDELDDDPVDNIFRPRPGELADHSDEVRDSGLFQDVEVRHFDWEVGYTADEYIELLDTFSGHLAMKAHQRERLYSEIRRRLAERADGRLRRHWGAVLHIARRTG